MSTTHYWPIVRTLTLLSSAILGLGGLPPLVALEVLIIASIYVHWTGS